MGFRAVCGLMAGSRGAYIETMEAYEGTIHIIELVHCDAVFGRNLLPPFSGRIPAWGLTAVKTSNLVRNLRLSDI
jgi:hypothetical protein